jgi:hypothetical protein
MQIKAPQHPSKWRGPEISNVCGRFVGQLFISVQREDTFLTSDGRWIKLFPGCRISRGRPRLILGHFKSHVAVDFSTSRLRPLAVPEEYSILG